MYFFLFFILHWYASLFFQSVFLHRYAAHRQFTMTKGWERCFYVCCFVTQGSSYISAYAYGIMHRLHHMHTDKKEDPHSPRHAKGVLGAIFQTRNNYFKIYSGKIAVDDKLKKDLPRWDSFEKIAHNWLTRIGWIMIYTAVYIFLAEAWWMYFFLPFTVAIGSIQGAAVNWWAHRFGYVNYKMNNDSKNILPFDFLFWGEAYHNNHHRFPGRVNYSHKWFEFDFGYWMLRLMERMKIIKLNVTT